MSCPAAPESPRPEIAMPVAEQWDGQTYYTDANGRVIGQQECIVKLNHYWRQLQLAQTEIKGHMRVKDELKSRIAELEANLALYYSQPGVKWAAAWASCERDRRELEARIAELEKAMKEVEIRLRDGGTLPIKGLTWALIDAALKDRA